MTTYLTNPMLKRVDIYLKDQPWFQDMIFDRTGTFPFPQKYMRDKYCQLDKVIAQGANIRKGVDLEYPDVAKSKLYSFTRLAEWFTARIDLSHEQRMDMDAGDPMIKTELDAQIDSVNFNFNKDRRTWFVNGPTSGTDVNYTSEWIPWYSLVATGSSSIGNPADMNGKAGGTSGTRLDLTASAVLWSSTTNQTVDFTEALLGKCLEAFEAFEDSNNGRRMVQLDQSGQASQPYDLYIHPVVSSRMKDVHPFNGEFVDFSQSVASMIEARGVKIIPDPSQTYSTAEDGECNFTLVANPTRNFGKGVINAPTWTKWVETNPGTLTPGAQKGFSVRYVPFTMPYYDATNYYKAAIIGKFTYKNDAG